jgi:hypothetical protein
MDWTALAIFSGSCGSGSEGFDEVPTAQNAHERVHTFPSSRNVAVPLDQHSCRFGHMADRQTVFRFFPASSCRTDPNWSFVENLRLSHSGFLSLPETIGAANG